MQPLPVPELPLGYMRDRPDRTLEAPLCFFCRNREEFLTS